MYALAGAPLLVGVHVRACTSISQAVLALPGAVAMKGCGLLPWRAPDRIGSAVCSLKNTTFASSRSDTEAETPLFGYERSLDMHVKSRYRSSYLVLAMEPGICTRYEEPLYR